MAQNLKIRLFRRILKSAKCDVAPKRREVCSIYICKPKITVRMTDKERGSFSGGKARKVYLMMVRYFAPACIVLIVIYSLVTMFL